MALPGAALLVVLLAGALDDADVWPLVTVPIGLLYVVACVPAFFGLTGWSWWAFWLVAGLSAGALLDRRATAALTPQSR
jgi:hypothetical protein